jgi:hypothetical protein
VAYALRRCGRWRCRQPLVFGSAPDTGDKDELTITGNV